MIDGNRRWARAAGFDDVSQGHLAGARHIANLLELVQRGRRRRTSRSGCCRPTTCAAPAEELEPLLRIIAGVAEELSRRRHPVAGQGRRRARPAAGRDRRGAQGGRGAHGRPRRPDRQRRRRLRRAPRDRRRRPLAAARARGARRHVHRGTRRGHRRRPHRRAPLHEGPARSRPGDPHVGRAAAVGFPALAVGALGVLLLRRAVAGLPQDRLPAGAARLRHAAAAVRRMTTSARSSPATGSPRTSTTSASSTCAGTSTARSGRAAYEAGHMPGRRLARHRHRPVRPGEPDAGRHPLPAPGALRRRARAGRHRRRHPGRRLRRRRRLGRRPGCGGCCTCSANRLRCSTAGSPPGPASCHRRPHLVPVDRAPRPWPAERFVDADAARRRVGADRRRPHRRAVRARRSRRRPAPRAHPRARVSAPWARQPRRRRPLPPAATQLRERFAAAPTARRRLLRLGRHRLPRPAGPGRRRGTRPRAVPRLVVAVGRRPVSIG